MRAHWCSMKLAIRRRTLTLFQRAWWSWIKRSVNFYLNTVPTGGVWLLFFFLVVWHTHNLPHFENSTFRVLFFCVVVKWISSVSESVFSFRCYATLRMHRRGNRRHSLKGRAKWCANVSSLLDRKYCCPKTPNRNLWQQVWLHDTAAHIRLLICPQKEWPLLCHQRGHVTNRMWLGWGHIIGQKVKHDKPDR